jgi:hypothetical protein
VSITSARFFLRPQKSAMDFSTALVRSGNLDFG